jgi:hypothetical protein
MARSKDITGKRVNEFTVISKTGMYSPNRCNIWLCLCDCGKYMELPTDTILRGIQKSCGCASSRKPIHIKHGHSQRHRNSATYSSWSNMKKRCNNPKNHKYRIYGGRGISVCDEWMHSFENFLNDMGVKPAGLTLERKDVNGNYNKENCEWASPKKQGNNKRNNRIIIFNGISKTESQWADDRGIPFSALRQRLYRGWNIDRALTQHCRGMV